MTEPERAIRQPGTILSHPIYQGGVVAIKALSERVVGLSLSDYASMMAAHRSAPGTRRRQLQRQPGRGPVDANGRAVPHGIVQRKTRIVAPGLVQTLLKVLD